MSFKSVSQLLQSAVQRFGDAPAIVTADRTESFRQLGNAVAAVAAELQACGVQAGDRVMIVAPNSIAMIHAWLGAIWAGGIPAAVNPASTESELEYFKTDLDPRLVLMERDVNRIDASALRRGSGSELIDVSDPLQVAAIVYTSGTTSRPKGAMVRHAAYTESGQSFPRWFGLGQDERLWACLPFFHINAQAYSLMATLAYGYTLAVSRQFHASTFWQMARDLGATSVNVVGAMLEFVARQPESAWVPSSLRTMYSAPVPPPRQRRSLEERFQVRIMSGYAMTENTFGSAESPTSRDKPGSVGRPRQPASGAFENRLRIVRPDGRDAAHGEVGELWFQNPVMAAGYWNAPELTATTLAGGWLRTGDAGYRDHDGDLFLTGRYKEMIRRRGENIAPQEVEDALRDHQAIQEVAVIGIAAGLQEEEVMAVVVLRPGASVDEASLKAFAGRRLSAYKIPSRIAFRESLPRTPTHRVVKDQLRKEYGGDFTVHAERPPNEGGQR